MEHAKAHDASLVGEPASAAAGAAPEQEGLTQVGDRATRPDGSETPPELPALTAFPRTEVALRGTLATAPLDIPSFTRPVARCSLAACRGMCCYDGVYVNEEEAAVIEEV